jgi:type VI protein secretion system component Hcp
VLKSTCVALLFLVPSVAAAQKSQAAPHSSTITLQIPGVQCTTAAGASTFKVESWSIGATNPGNLLGGSGSGKPSLQDLHVMKAFDGCSPALLGLVTGGLVMKEATLTQTGSDVTKTTVVELLDGVLVTSWQLSSATTQQGPTESVSLSFRKVCVTDTASGAPKVCYDSVTTP